MKDEELINLDMARAAAKKYKAINEALVEYDRISKQIECVRQDIPKLEAKRSRVSGYEYTRNEELLGRRYLAEGTLEERLRAAHVCLTRRYNKTLSNCVLRANYVHNRLNERR